MAEETQRDEAIVPPYLPWPTFTAFIEKLNKTAVPNRIDPTVIKNLSGTVQGQLLNALKFLELTNGNGAVTEALKNLVKAYATPKWREILGEHFLESYGELIGTLDLDTATPGELRERFREVGEIEGDTVEKAMRFYLNALKDAGISYSPHLKIRQRATRGPNKKTRRNTADGGSGIEDDDAFAAPEDTFKIPLDVLGVNAVLFLPMDINQKRWEAISQYVKTVIGLRTTAMGGDDETAK